MTILNGANGTTTHPASREYVSNPSWPLDLSRLFDEAAGCYSASAFTASAMTSRKVLMACACHEGDKDGETFGHYVDFITKNVLNFERAKASIDAIRKIGNDGNHKIEFVNKEDAKRALNIVQYLLNTIYSLPKA